MEPSGRKGKLPNQGFEQSHVARIVAPQLGVGGYVLNDNAGPGFIAYIRDPRNGFISTTLPIKRGTELALKIT